MEPRREWRERFAFVVAGLESRRGSVLAGGAAVAEREQALLDANGRVPHAGCVHVMMEAPTAGRTARPTSGELPTPRQVNATAATSCSAPRHPRDRPFVNDGPLTACVTRPRSPKAECL
jgi:hypothetical protein